MTHLFGVCDVKYLYLLSLLSLVSEGGTEINCTFHSKYCFFVEEIHSPTSAIEDLERACGTCPNAWPLEIYDAKVQGALDDYLASLNSTYSLKRVFLNVNRSEGGWRYVHDSDGSKTVDFILAHHEDVAFFDVFEDNFETGWMNYFQLPYICSFKPSSPSCNLTGSLVTSDLCFTRHEGGLTWVQALNDCRSRYGYLALMRFHHKAQVRRWLMSFPGELNQWWIGVAWRPLKWRKKGTTVTWWNFQPHSKFMLTPDEIHFEIQADNNRWKVEKDSYSSDVAVCMTEKDQAGLCKGRECQMEKRRIPIVEIIVVVVVVVVVAVVVVAAVKMWLRKKRRQASPKRIDKPEPTKGVPGPSPRSDQPIYFQPLPNVYEEMKNIKSDENHYDKLMV